MNKIKKQKNQEKDTSSDESETSNSTQSDQPEQEEEKLFEQKEEVYKKIRSKLEILDIIFHPSNDNLIYLGLINGKIKM
jgi:hypothetical protein